MKIKSNTLGILVLVILFGGIMVGSAMDMWITESTKIPNKIASVASTEVYNPEDIKGSYEFGEVSELFEIPLDDLASAFDLPEGVEYSKFKIKELETIYAEQEFEIGNGSVKWFVALYKGLPFELSEETFLLENAVRILKEKADLTKDQIEYLDSHIVNK